ncbi:MAG: NACHT domain-containing protein [Candidatus Thiodiazotropha lotti]|nr:NACHT domain-containing protein [Candidatus Thiodiazotropha lotti]
MKRSKEPTADELKNHRLRGRSGGRAGGAGYDFQDLYVALQLAKLLIGTGRNSPIEVMWEKKSIDLGANGGGQRVHIADVIVRYSSGKTIQTQVKETAPGSRWSIARLVKGGIIKGFWEEWQTQPSENRTTTVLRLASAADVTPLRNIVDVAKRARTPQELLSDEASHETMDDVLALSKSLGLEPQNQEFLSFLKCLDGEQLTEAKDLEDRIVESLVASGDQAANITRLLVRLVASSKHIGLSARSAYTKKDLIDDLLNNGVDETVLIGIKVIAAAPVSNSEIWDHYRASVVKEFGTFRLYGIGIDKPVYADLTTAFVPLRFIPIATGVSDDSLPNRKTNSNVVSTDLPHRPITIRLLSGEGKEDDDSRWEGPEWTALPEILSKQKRVALIGGPGAGKTTTLRWLALICAMSGAKGRTVRTAYGLPSEPLLPVYVRFRQLADRIHERGLQSVPWRGPLVIDFITAQLEAGLLGTAPSREEALSIAHELMSSQKTVFLFDGLDEVTDESTRGKLFDAVLDLVSLETNLRVISSWRPHALKRDLDALGDFAVFQPLPLNHTERRTFAQQWYAALHQLPAEFNEETSRQKRSNDLAQSAEKHTDISEIPLLYSILALVHFSDSGLPLNRTVLYDRATRAMLGHWEENKVRQDMGQNVPYGSLSPLLSEDTLRRAIGFLAYSAQCKEGLAEFSHKVTVDALHSALTTIELDAPLEKEAILCLVQHLIERCGVLQERAAGILAFAHLSFQEYLAARWLVEQPEPDLNKLANMADDDRHTEVVRYAVAILAGIESEPSQKMATTLLERMAGKNAALSAACLWETPKLSVTEESAKRIARELWFDLTDFHHHRVHPRVFVKLFWTALSHVREPDQLFLEALSLGENEPRHKMGHEGHEMVFSSRPPSDILSKDLKWYLQQLSSIKNEHEYFPVRDLAVLFLIEAGEISAGNNLRSLANILDWDHWWQDVGDKQLRPDHRSKQQIMELLKQKDSRGATLDSLRLTLIADDVTRRTKRRLVQLLLDVGEPLTDSLTNVLIDGYLSQRWEHEKGIQRLKILATRPGCQNAIVEGAKRGLASGDQETRQGSFALLQELDVTLPRKVSLEEDQEREPRLDQAHTIALGLGTEASKERMEILAECLWDEDEDIAWQSARILMDNGQTAVPGIPHVLVTTGLNASKTREAATKDLEHLWDDVQMGLTVRASLLEGIRSADNAVATAAAILLMTHGEAGTGTRTIPIVRAALKDTEQFPAALSQMKMLLADPLTQPATLKATGVYFATDLKKEIASPLAILVAELGYLDTPNLARALVLGALADPFHQQAAIGYLLQMLEDGNLVTATRQALANGLKFKSRAVAWGSACCLWKAGSRTDPELPKALVQAGLTNESTREKAHAWLLELLSESSTTDGSRNVLESEAESFGWRDKYEKDYDLAWELARCLRAACMYRIEQFPNLLILGGFYRQERHQEVTNCIRDLCNSEPWLVAEIKKELLEALTSETKDIAWGAGRILFNSWKDTTTFPPDLLLNESDKEFLNQASDLVRVALRKQQSDLEATEFLQRICRHESKIISLEATAKLLEDKDQAAAYQAACFLLAIGKVNETALPSALISGGLTNQSFSLEAAEALDSLQKNPATTALVWNALNKALWGENKPAAIGAALYLIEQGETANPGVARGLVFGGFDYGFWLKRKAQHRVLAFLKDPKTRQNTIFALETVLHNSQCGERFELTSLLLRAGAPLSTPILKDLDKMTRRHPEATLAVLALTGRCEEVRQEAKHLGLTSIIEAIGEPPFPGNTVQIKIE